MNRIPTADQIALSILLSRAPKAERESTLSRLQTQVQDRLENRASCPECGDAGPHEDNGERGANLAYCCRTCGAHFDAEQV